ncbi:MAG: hypothetical protein D6719_10340 [Candidatus Dadabacteria bacterium]|nr:MAG: hypothetical protein D6719_10340 [Candidatus Dadabacteria bacterium]
MSSSLKLRYKFLPPGYAGVYNLSLKLPEYTLPELADNIIRTLYKLRLLGSNQLKDFKGRDRANLLNSNLPASLKPVSDELLFISGELYPQMPADSREDTVPYVFHINTPFESFEDNNHIVYRIKRGGSGLPSFLHERNIARNFPNKIELFRLGLDLFHSKRTFAFLGYYPVVTETLLIEASAEDMALKITWDSFKARDILPLERMNLLGELSEAIGAAVNFSIKEDLQQKIL